MMPIFSAMERMALLAGITGSGEQCGKIVCSCFAVSEEKIKAAIQAGCDGLCLEAQLGMGTVLAALTAVSGGGIYIERSLGELFLANAPGPHPVPLAPLSEREIQVLQLAAGGHSNQEIGARLFIALETVKTHMRNILQKLQARDRTHAVTIALQRGLLQLRIAETEKYAHVTYFFNGGVEAPFAGEERKGFLLFLGP